MAIPERRRDEAIGGPAFTALVLKLRAKGLTIPQAAAAIGGAHGGRTRREIVEALRTWLKNRPKG